LAHELQKSRFLHATCYVGINSFSSNCIDLDVGGESTSSSFDFALAILPGHLRVEIIATGLDHINNVMSYKVDKIKLQLKVVVLISSYFSFIILISPSPIVASNSLVCGRPRGTSDGLALIVNRRANASSTKCCLS
jgi:hypothetical protein